MAVAGGVAGTGPGPPHAIAGAAATAAAGLHPPDGVAAGATAAALLGQSAGARLPDEALPGLLAGHQQGVLSQPVLPFALNTL